MTGSSDVSRLCRKVGFRVTLFSPSGPATGASRAVSGWPKVNIQTMVAQTRHHRTAPPRWILSVCVDGTEMLLLLAGSIACAPPCSSWMIPLSAKRPQCDLAACLVVALRWGNRQALGRDPSIMHSHPRSTLSIQLLCGLSAKLQLSQQAHTTTGCDLWSGWTCRLGIGAPVRMT